MSATSTTANPSPRSARPQAGTGLLYGIFGLLMFGPLAFGAVEPWSIFVMEAGSAVLFLLWVGKQVLEGEMKIRWNPLFLPMGVFGLLIVSQLVFRVSAYPHDTLSLALQYFSYAVLCFLAAQTLLRGAQARTLCCDFFCVRSGAGWLCVDPGHLLERQVVLASAAPHGRLDLWSLCKPQPLRRFDGNAGSHSAGVVADAAGFQPRPAPRQRRRRP